MVSHVLHGNGELIVHLAELKTASPDVFPLAGVTVRGEMSTQAPHLTLVAGRSSGWFVRHAERSIDSLYVEKPLHLPVWLRLVRSGPDVRAYWSEDKHQWTLAGSMTFDAGQDLLIGLSAFALNAKEPATAEFDHLSLTTGGQAGLASGAGVQLTNGSIVYGVPDVQEATIAVHGADGKIYRFGRDQVARLFYAPVGTDMAAALTPGWRGAIVRNDLVEGEVSEVTSDGAKVSSVLFGIQEVKRDNGLRAVILQDVNPPGSAITIGYPGGRVLATNVSLDDNKLVIHDAPGGELRLSITELLSLHRSP
jgi:hypothetical protein